MRVLFKRNQQERRPSPPSQQQQLLLNGSPRTLVSPLDIPEILEIIFSYINDLTTLRRTVILVCRQWFLMNRHKVIQEVVWDDIWSSWKLLRILNRLPSASRVIWASQLRGKSEKAKEQEWSKLVQALKRAHGVNIKRLQQQQQQQQQLEKRGKQRLQPLFEIGLRELELIGILPTSSRLESLLPYVPMLTNLQMTVRYRGRIHVDMILESCPKLTTLHLTDEYSHHIFLPGPWIPFSNHTLDKDDNGHDKGHGSERQLQQRKQKQERQSIPLRSLVLQNMVLPQESLEALLSITPALQELKLINLCKYIAHDELATLADASFEYDRQRLLGHLCSLTLNQTLQSFHFSSLDDHPSEEILQETIHPKMFPKVTEWSFWSKDWNLSLVQCLDQVRNTITTLELVSSRHVVQPPVGRLHAYLCASPHLLHLKAPDTWFLLQHMDLHLREDIDMAVNEIRPLHAMLAQEGLLVTPSVLPIWACRNLRTLHMSVCRLGNNFMAAPAHSRVLFGYISRVCPQLRDLQIHANQLCIKLSGGLCLLARLKHLERLVVRIAKGFWSLEDYDLTWMAPPTPPEPTTTSTWPLLGKGKEKSKCFEIRAQERQSRRQIVETWKDRIQWEEEKEAEYRQRFQNAPTDPTNTNNTINTQLYNNSDTNNNARCTTEDDNEDDCLLRHELRNLGLLVDVKLMLDELDGNSDKDFKCWPTLQQISLSRSCGDKPNLEEAVARLFPRKHITRPRLR